MTHNVIRTGANYAPERIYMSSDGVGGEITELAGVRMLVKAALAEATGMFLVYVGDETCVPVEKLRQILDEVGHYMDRLIPELNIAPNTLTVGSLVERIYREQTSFPVINTTQ